MESFRKRMCWFKTSMQTLEKVENEVQALRAAIHYYTWRYRPQSACKRRMRRLEIACSIGRIFDV